MSFPWYPANQGGYRNVNNGLDKYYPGTLHTLYPGRFLGTPHYTGVDIEHEHPELVAKLHQQEALNASKSAHTLHNINLNLGGIGKINRHPAVEPERTIEDPLLTGLNIKPPAETDQYFDSHSEYLSEGQIQHKLSHLSPGNVTEKDVTESETDRALLTNTPAEQRKALSVSTPDHPSYIPPGSSALKFPNNYFGQSFYPPYSNSNPNQMTDKIYYNFDTTDIQESNSNPTYLIIGNSISHTALISIIAVFIVIIMIFLLYVVYRHKNKGKMDIFQY